MVDCTVAMVQCTVRYSGTVAVVAAGWQQSHDSSPQSPHTAARQPLLGLTTTASTPDTGHTAATSCGWGVVGGGRGYQGRHVRGHEARARPEPGLAPAVVMSPWPGHCSFSHDTDDTLPSPT